MRLRLPVLAVYLALPDWLVCLIPNLLGDCVLAAALSPATGPTSARFFTAVESGVIRWT
jgi:hypothetical protein